MNHADLCGRKLTDIVAEGFFEDGAPGRFTPMFSAIYLELEDGLVVLQSLEQYSRMAISAVDEYRPKFAVDPDTRYGVCSLGSVLMVHPSDNCWIDRVEIYRSDEPSGEQRTCALGLLLGTGQYMFFDPTQLSGINVGGPEQRAYWLQNLLPQTIVSCTIVCRSDPGAT